MNPYEDAKRVAIALTGTEEEKAQKLARFKNTLHEIAELFKATGDAATARTFESYGDGFYHSIVKGPRK